MRPSAAAASARGRGGAALVDRGDRNQGGRRAAAQGRLLSIGDRGGGALDLFRPRVWRWTPAFLFALVSYAGVPDRRSSSRRSGPRPPTRSFSSTAGSSGCCSSLRFVLKEPFRARDAVAVTVAFGGIGLFFVGEFESRGRAGRRRRLWLSGVFFAALVLALRRERGAGAEAASRTATSSRPRSSFPSLLGPTSPSPALAASSWLSSG